MTRARETQVDLEVTPYYHVVNRCVRRAFLCGMDDHTGQNYEHRRQWIEDRIFFLAEHFCIDICAYAIMHNHYHIVLHVDQDQAKSLTNKEVFARWEQIYSLKPLESEFLYDKPMTPGSEAMIPVWADEYRTRLCNLSEFMAALNYFIARQANIEDEVTGRFWEGRFKSQALLDEKALAAAMAYVDLNPVRAKIAATPETSDYTSIQLRTAIRQSNNQPKQLMPFVGNPKQDQPKGLPFELDDYLQLVDWSGRHIDEQKRGYIDNALPDIIDRLEFDPREWLFMAKHFESKFKSLVGTAFSIKRACTIFGRKSPPTHQVIT